LNNYHNYGPTTSFGSPGSEASAGRTHAFAELANESVNRLDALGIETRLAALKTLREIEHSGRQLFMVGPSLPNYVHVHTTASYGYGVPGVYSVSHMVWSAHESRAPSTLIIEHESVAHLEEAERAIAIVNRDSEIRLNLALGVEFKAPIALDSPISRAFSSDLRQASGQGEAAWVVGVGAKSCGELTQLVEQFQAAKWVRAEKQLKRLNHYLSLSPSLEIRALVGPTRNITDRSLCIAVAKKKWPAANDVALLNNAKAVRKLLNPGGPAYASYPRGLPSYQDLIARLAQLGLIPSFTAQMRARALATHLAALVSWGIRALDTAGIEPTDPEAEKEIQELIVLASRHQLGLIGGSDYRGAGTGWSCYLPWMDHPLMKTTIGQLARA